MNTRQHVVSTKDGRKLQIIEAGQPDGIPVLVHNGTPGARLLYEGWVVDAQSRGIRLISYDRPGYGGSTSQPGRKVANAAEDVKAIAQALDIRRLLVWGISGGGPHALACAALLPDLVVAAASLAALAPYPADGLDWFAGMGEDNVSEFGFAFKGREAIQKFVEAASPGMLTADPAALMQAFRTLLCPVDVAVFTEELASYLLKTVQEGIQGKGDGWVDDDLAFTLPWGFKLDQIRIPVLLVHGEQDQMVPVSHGRWLADRIPDVEARFLPEDGHLTLSAHRIADVHAWLLSRMQ
jgi:pimeloyl-ACP methyl ester carboxylesterase